MIDCEQLTIHTPGRQLIGLRMRPPFTPQDSGSPALGNGPRPTTGEDLSLCGMIESRSRPVSSGRRRHVELKGEGKDVHTDQLLDNYGEGSVFQKW